MYVSLLFWVSLFFPHPTPVGHHRAPDWTPFVIKQLPTSILHMIVYICQCCFLNTAHPLLPLLCPQFLLCQVHKYHFAMFHVYALIYDSCFFSLTSLCIRWYRFIHYNWLRLVPVYSWVKSTVLLYHNCYIHSSVTGHLDCFHFVAIVNIAAINTII
mgnify:CR=1 FL=1